MSGVLYQLALALLVGGGVLYTFVLTPVVFHAYPRNMAAEIVGTMMPHYFTFQFAALAAATLTLAVAGRGLRLRRLTLCLALLVCALAAQGFVRWQLYPRILSVKSKVATFEADPDAPERRRFRSLHGVSMAINLLVLADGALLLTLASLDRVGDSRRSCPRDDD